MHNEDDVHIMEVYPGGNSSSRQICNDGTLSPTCICTPSIPDVYGCTDKNAVNYNENANKDDGSCIKNVIKKMAEI